MLSQTKMSNRHVVSLHIYFTGRYWISPFHKAARQCVRQGQKPETTAVRVLSNIEHRCSTNRSMKRFQVNGWSTCKISYTALWTGDGHDVWDCALVWQLCVFSVKLQGVELSRPFSIPRSHRGCASCFCRIIETKNVRSIFYAWGTDSYASMCERPHSCHSSPDGRAMVWRPM